MTSAGKQLSNQLTEDLRARFLQTGDALQLLKSRTAGVDTAVLEAQAAALTPAFPEGLALVAVGGYGRRELFPYSDVDLLILSRRPLLDSASRSAVSDFVRSLWDCGLRCSQSVHTIEESCALHDGNQASLAPLKQKIGQAEHLLATLEGVMPSNVTLPDIDLHGLPLPLDLPVSLPSDLVRQRPDILSAEEQLHIASANIGVATAAMFPSFGNLPTASGRFWSIGPSATVPLFQGGSLWYGRKAAVDAFQVSQANYRQTVLAAFAQVADSLQALEHDAEALQAEVDAQSAAAEALDLLQTNYRAGLVAYLEVLAADVQFHQTSIAYVQAVAQRHQDTVALFVSLGGGWWNRQRPNGEDKSP